MTCRASFMARWTRSLKISSYAVFASKFRPILTSATIAAKCFARNALTNGKRAVLSSVQARCGWGPAHTFSKSSLKHSRSSATIVKTSCSFQRSLSMMNGVEKRSAQTNSASGFLNSVVARNFNTRSETPKCVTTSAIKCLSCSRPWNRVKPRHFFSSSSISQSKKQKSRSVWSKNENKPKLSSNDSCRQLVLTSDAATRQTLVSARIVDSSLMTWLGQSQIHGKLSVSSSLTSTGKSARQMNSLVARRRTA